jgi:hypothetical protein
MKKNFCIAVAFCTVVAFAISETQARPGGGRGGRAAGGRPGGNRPNISRAGDGPIDRGSNLGGAQLENLTPKNLNGGQFGNAGSGAASQKFQAATAQSRFGAAQNKASQLQANFTSRNEPFTPAWYADHPNAWQTTHPHADAWAVATIGTAAAWLGWGGYGYADDSTVYTSESEEATTDESADDSTTETSQQAAQPETATAEELVARGSADVPEDAEFMPLGVFALAPENQKDAAAVMQLSLSKDGILRGTYCDLLTDQGQTVMGAVDKASKLVAWKLSSEGRVIFESTLGDLTQATGGVRATMPGGDIRQFVLARYDNQTSENKTSDNQQAK